MIYLKSFWLACISLLESENVRRFHLCKLDDKKVEKTRELLLNSFEKVRSKKYFFSPKNQGCKLGVSNAINWFFENEKEGIILEDDCIPHLDFFIFCQEMLAIYRNDERIWSITGHNQQNNIYPHKDPSVLLEQSFGFPFQALLIH